MSTGVWVRQGVAIVPNTADLNGGNPASGTEEPTVLYDSDPQILPPNGDGKIFKMWFAGGNDIYYAESSDGITNWTRHAAKLFTGKGHQRVFKDGSTYYLSLSSQTGPFRIDLYSSPSNDGINWTLFQASIIVPGASGAWDDQGVFHAFIWKEGTNVWKCLYDGIHGDFASGGYFTGLATSTDGKTWTKSSSNPVITLAPRTSAGAFVTKVGSTYYAWMQCCRGNSTFAQPNQEPSDIYRFQSTDLVNWTLSPTSPTLARLTPDESPGLNTGGQVADPCLCEVNGNTYLYYEGALNTPPGTGFVLKVATAPLTIAQLVATDEGNFDPTGGQAVPIAFIQSANTNGGDAAHTSQDLAYGSNNTAGSLLVVTGRMARASGTLSTVVVSDSANGSWTVVYNNFLTPDNLYFMAYRENCAEGPNTVTVSGTGTPSCFFQYQIAEYSGIKLTSPLDSFVTANQGGGTSTAAATAPVTPTFPRSLIVCHFANQTANGLTLTAGTGFNKRETVDGNGALEDQIVSSVAAKTPAMTYSSAVNWNGGAAVFIGAQQASSRNVFEA